MLKKRNKLIFTYILLPLTLLAPLALTHASPFFNITTTGSLGSVNLSLCLNGQGPLSCQNATVSALDLSISTTIANHTYPAAGIKINSPGYTFENCTPLANGYCLFSVSQTTPTSISLAQTGTPYTIGGNISNLSGELILQNNGTNPYTTSSSGAFTFSASQASGSTYDVSVSSQPETQTCSVTNGSGIVGNSNITNIGVTCATHAYTVGGVVSNLGSGKSLVLQNNGTDGQTETANGAFTFSTPIAQGAPYNVSVQTQPAGQSCTITNGSGTMGGSNVTNVQVNCAENVTTLGTSVSSLALSVNDPSLNSALTGTPRQITITNTGSATAVNVSYSTSPALPSGTSISPGSCGTIAPGGTCVLTITPGATPSAAPGNPTPTPTTLNISGNNTNTVNPFVSILTYGSAYQNGYIFSINDATPNTGSIGGTIAALTDQSTSLAWNPSSNTSIWGIAETSTTLNPVPNGGGAFKYTGQANCNGSTDGACNENNIYTYYQTYASGAPLDPSTYAAGRCKQSINGYSDWYLPSICQMGYEAAGCGTQSSPTRQNIQSNLIDNNVSGAPTGYYWSSTEYSSNSQNNVWLEYFNSSSTSQLPDIKNNAHAVRCVRELTP